jgi:hypothetical protein
LHEVTNPGNGASVDVAAEAEWKATIGGQSARPALPHVGVLKRSRQEPRLAHGSGSSTAIVEKPFDHCQRSGSHESAGH